MIQRACHTLGPKFNAPSYNDAHPKEVVMTRYFAALLMFLVAWPSFAADPNGYTAEYECRAGGSHCNVDVASYVAAVCAQTITTADSISTIQSKLNAGSSPICITNGDYTSKGTISITASGSTGNYRVMRYYRSSDNNDEPWNQTSTNQVKILGLKVNADYWIIHRLTFPGIDNGVGPSPRIESGGGKTHHIFNRLLVEGKGGGSSYYGYSQNCSLGGYSDLTVQNSVFRNEGPEGPDKEAIAVDLQCGDNMRAVNNEIYNWVSHPIQIGHNFPNPTRSGVVVENNDLYVTSALYTNGGATAKSESVLSLKMNGTSTSPVRIIHNRMWGTRLTDLNFCCNGEGGNLVTNYEVLEYALFQNNILFDAQSGLGNIANNQSAVGNIFWKIKKYFPTTNSIGIGRWQFANAPAQSKYEIYLNTFIDADGEYSIDRLDNNDVDTRCNVLIASGPMASGSVPSSSIADYNAFYGSPLFTFNGTNTNINETLSTRTNSATYNSGAVIRTTSTPPANGTAGDFLYLVTTAGQSASSPPAYCTILGCTTQDGTMVVRAIRGPYPFYRKLKTGPEQVFIPYARVHESAPEALGCPSNYAARNGIGINDKN
jgi:hypothetical protein